MAAKNLPDGSGGTSGVPIPDSFEGGPQDWAFTCGVCHPGGGQMEYDREMADYGTTADNNGDNFWFYWNPNTQSITDGSITAGFMNGTNKAEVDCLMCHLYGSGGAGHGRAALQTLGCSDAYPIGPLNDKNCDGTPDPGYPPASLIPTAGMFQPCTAYDMYNRNIAVKARALNYAASLGLGAIATFNDANGDGVLGNPEDTIAGISWNNAWQITVGTTNYIGVPGDAIKGTPSSRNCAVCHARDDDLPGLPGRITMKYGYGNYMQIMPAGTMWDDDHDGPNPEYWFELGCKTGMGKRGHKVTAQGDATGPNARYGMSMFLPSTLDADPATTPNMGDPIPGKMPDIDVHNAGINGGIGLECADCHYAVGSSFPLGLRDPSSITIPAFEHVIPGEGTVIDYPETTVMGLDHQFAQGDSDHDCNSWNVIDWTISCESCHMPDEAKYAHPRLQRDPGTGELVTDANGNFLLGTDHDDDNVIEYVPVPHPAHTGFPAIHFQKIACNTCHVPEIYGAPGKMAYRDWTAGPWKNGWRNMLDWNYDLVTGSHAPMPVQHEWLTKYDEKKIYPVAIALLPLWFEDLVDVDGETWHTPVKARLNTAVAKAVAQAHPEFDIRLNGGNLVPLFDGFSLADSWEIDTAAEVQAMVTEWENRGHQNVDLHIFTLDFDVTHGIVPKEWALGGSARHGCVSCHSSADPSSPNYSPYSVGFFEGLEQPLNNAPGLGVGGYDVMKNWFALFADYDCTAYCGGGSMTDADLFDPFTNAPRWGTACATGSPMDMMDDGNATNGSATIDMCVGFMAQTFDAVMGFPAGTAMQMGMWDGIAGLQGFTIRETVSGSTFGCNPFAGPVNGQVAQLTGQSVNNCIPSSVTGSCNVTAQVCLDGFRAGGWCADDADCSGALSDATELAHNPNGLLYSRAEARSHFKISLQQVFVNGTPRVNWPIGGEQNPGNPAHVNKWNQGLVCYDPMTGADADCSVSPFIRTVIPANALLGYNEATLAVLMQNQSSIETGSVKARFAFEADQTTDFLVHFTDRSLCRSGNCAVSWDFGDGATGAGAVGMSIDHTYAAEGDYTVTLTVVDNTTGFTNSKALSVSALGHRAAPEASGSAIGTPVYSDGGTPDDPSDDTWTVDFTVDGLSASTATLFVDWGDGTAENIAAPAIPSHTVSHTYNSIGTYYIKYVVLDSTTVDGHARYLRNDYVAGQLVIN